MCAVRILVTHEAVDVRYLVMVVVRGLGVSDLMNMACRVEGESKQKSS